MFRLPMLTAAAVLCLIDFPFFGDRPADPLKLPSPDKVDRVVVQKEGLEGSGFETPKPIVISDRKRIAAILDFFGERNKDWRSRFGTFPSFPYTVTFERKDGREYKLMLVTWVTTGMVGGRDGGQDARHNRLRDLTKEDSRKLFKLLGIAVPVEPRDP